MCTRQQLRVQDDFSYENLVSIYYNTVIPQIFINGQYFITRLFFMLIVAHFCQSSRVLTKRITGMFNIGTNIYTGLLIIVDKMLHELTLTDEPNDDQIVENYFCMPFINS